MKKVNNVRISTVGIVLVVAMMIALVGVFATLGFQADAGTAYADPAQGGEQEGFPEGGELYVAGVDILAAGTVNAENTSGVSAGTATVSYDEENSLYVLTLNNFVYEGDGRNGSVIYFKGGDNEGNRLLIRVIGENSFTCTSHLDAGMIYLVTPYANLIIDGLAGGGTGSLSVSGNSFGIFTAGATSISVYSMSLSIDSDVYAVNMAGDNNYIDDNEEASLSLQGYTRAINGGNMALSKDGQAWDHPQHDPVALIANNYYTSQDLSSYIKITATAIASSQGYDTLAVTLDEDYIDAAPWDDLTDIPLAMNFPTSEQLVFDPEFTFTIDSEDNSAMLQPMPSQKTLVIMIREDAGVNAMLEALFNKGADLAVTLNNNATTYDANSFDSGSVTDYYHMYVSDFGIINIVFTDYVDNTNRADTYSLWIYISREAQGGGQGGSGSGSSGVEFTKVESVDQIAAENIEECTFDQAKAWIVAHWGDITATDQDLSYVVYSNGTDLQRITISSWESAEEFENGVSPSTVSIEDCKGKYGLGFDLYLCTNGASGGGSGDEPSVTTYYLVGEILTNGTTNDEYVLTLNTEADTEEYDIDVTFTGDDAIRICKVVGDTVTWYPANEEDAIQVMAWRHIVRFRPDEFSGNGWYQGVRTEVVEGGGEPQTGELLSMGELYIAGVDIVQAGGIINAQTPGIVGTISGSVEVVNYGDEFGQVHISLHDFQYEGAGCTVGGITAGILYTGPAYLIFTYYGDNSLLVTGENVYGIYSGNEKARVMIRGNSGNPDQDTFTIRVDGGYGIGGVVGEDKFIVIGGNMTVSGFIGANLSQLDVYNPEGGTVNIIGTEQAVLNKVRSNDLTGTGWTDTAGTQGETSISATDTGSVEVPQYKRLQFTGTTGQGGDEQEAQHTHNYSGEWSYDANTHWHACLGEGDCDAPRADETSHMFANTTDTTDYYICTVCGYVNEDRQEEYDEAQSLHTHVGWTAWTSTTLLPSEAGSYYLTADVTITSTWNVPEGTVNLCLNGYGIKWGSNDTYYSMIKLNNSNTTLNLYDCGNTVHYYDVNNGIRSLFASNVSKSVFGVGSTFTQGGSYNFNEPVYFYNEESNAPAGAFSGELSCTGAEKVSNYVIFYFFNLYTETMYSFRALYGDASSVPNSFVIISGTGTYADPFHVSFAGRSDYSSELQETQRKSFYGGYITGANRTSGSGGAIWVNSGTFNLYGGTLLGNAAGSGGAVYVSESTSVFNMHGGTIMYNNATGSNGGAGVLANYGASFNMYGGEISNNYASYYGGGVFAGGEVGGSKVRLFGGVITLNMAGQNGGGVYKANSSAKIYLSGNPVIKENYDTLHYNNVYVAGTNDLFYITDELTEGASIRVTFSNQTNAITSGWGSAMGAADPIDYFESDVANKYFEVVNGEVVISHIHSYATGDDWTYDDTYHWHACTVEENCDSTSDKAEHTFGEDLTQASYYICSCGYEDSDRKSEYEGAKPAHTHDDDVIFTAWTSTNSLPTQAGSYYLSADVTISSTWNVPTGETNLCLNGHGITMTGNDCVVYVASGCTLNIYDCGDTTHYFNVDGNSVATGINTTSGSNHFEGGYVTGGRGKASTDYRNGGGIFIDGTFNLYGGNIIGNQVTVSDNCGAGVFCNDNSTFRMYGGCISYNYAQNAGCAIFAWHNASVEIYGGEIAHNKTYHSFGSAISFWNQNGYTVSLKLYGGYIHDNLTQNSGGAVALSATGLSVGLKGNLIVCDNVSNSTNANATRNVLVGNTPIIIEGALTNTVKIPIRLSSGTGTFTSGWSYYMGDADPADYFVSEAGYDIILLNGEAYCGNLVASVTVDEETTYFASLSDANDACPEGGTVVLLIDIDLTGDNNVTIEVKENITLDLNGHTLTFTFDTTSSQIDLADGRVLTLDNSVPATGGVKGMITTGEGAYLVLKNCRLIFTKEDLEATSSINRIAENYTIDEIDEDGFKTLIRPMTAAEIVIKLIDEIILPATKDQKDKIDAAREAYDDLDDDEKDDVTNRDKLFIAEVEELIDEIPTPAGKNDKEAIEKARKAYDELDDDKKDDVTNKDKLFEAEVDLVEELIDEIPDPVEDTPECKDKIDAAREAYDALDDDEKEDVENRDKLFDAEDEYARMHDVKWIVKMRAKTKVPEEYAAYIAEDEKIVRVYDVTLYKKIGDEQEVLAQPSEMKVDGTGKITVKLTIPDALKGKEFRILHVHSAEEYAFVEFTTDEDGKRITIRDVAKLSDFAFVAKTAVLTPAGQGGEQSGDNGQGDNEQGGQGGQEDPKDVVEDEPETQDDPTIDNWTLTPQGQGGQSGQGGQGQGQGSQGGQSGQGGQGQGQGSQGGQSGQGGQGQGSQGGQGQSGQGQSGQGGQSGQSGEGQAPQQPVVTVALEDCEPQEGVTVEVEVKADVSQEVVESDKSVLDSRIQSDDEIAIVYEVKLIRVTVEDGVEVREEIQPSDIKPGAVVVINMEIPEELRGKPFRLLHIHSDDDIKEVTTYTVSEDGTMLTIRVDRLSEFAFVGKKASGGNGGKGGYGENGEYEEEIGPNKIPDGAIAAIVIFGSIGALILGFLIWLLLKRRKEDDDDDGKGGKGRKGIAGKEDVKRAHKAAKPVEEKPKAAPIAEVSKAPVKAAETRKEKAAEDDGIGLKESLAIAATATRSEKITKAFVTAYLAKNYANCVECNTRENFTKTGLPLADTHYVTKGGNKVCFIYVYETDGATMLLLKTKDALGEELAKAYPSVRKSAFPKAKDRWYSVVVDDKLTDEQLKDMIDRTIAVYTGATVKKKTFAPIQTVKKVTVTEAIKMIEDEVAAASIVKAEKPVAHTGKKDIVNVDTLSQNFNAGDTITLEALKAKKLVPANSKQVKLLARGELNKVLHVELQDYSIEAVKMIVATGGTVKCV